MATTTLKITGMSCAHCVKKIETALGNQQGVKEAKVDLPKGVAEVKYDDSVQTIEQLTSVVKEVGYEAEPIN